VAVTCIQCGKDDNTCGCMSHGSLMDFLTDFRGGESAVTANGAGPVSEPVPPPPAEAEPTRSVQPSILGQLRNLAVSAPPDPDVDPRTGIPPTASLFVQTADNAPISPPAKPVEARPSRSPVVRPPTAAPKGPPAAPTGPPAARPVPRRSSPEPASLAPEREKGERSEWLSALLTLDWQENREASAAMFLGIGAILLPLLAIPSVILAVGCLRRLPFEPWRKGKARAHAAIVASAVLAPISLAVWISLL
jgi:hypothetical protein